MSKNKNNKKYIILAEIYKEDILTSFIVQDSKGRVKEIKSKEFCQMK